MLRYTKKLTLNHYLMKYSERNVSQCAVVFTFVVAAVVTSLMFSGGMKRDRTATFLQRDPRIGVFL